MSDLVGVFNFTFYNPAKPKPAPKPTAALLKTAIRLGPTSARYLVNHNIGYVKVGYDPHFKLIALVACGEDDPYKLKVGKISKNGIFFSVTKTFYEQLSVNINEIIGDRKSFSFPASWRDNPKMLLIDLDPANTTKPWMS